MTKRKFRIVWAVAMVVYFVLVNVAGAALLTLTGTADHLMESVENYAAKVVLPLPEPADQKERTHNGSVMVLRSHLSDHVLENHLPFYYNAFFQNLTVDGSFIFLKSTGTNKYSEGCFIAAYHQTDETMAYMKNPVGLVNVNRLAEQEGAADLQKALEENIGAAVYLTRYALAENEVIPAEIKVVGSSGETICTQNFSAEGELIDSDDCKLHDSSQGSEEPTVHLLASQLKLARKGDRRSHRIARSLMDSVPFDQSDYKNGSTKYGIMSITKSYVEVKDGNAMIFVYIIDYWKGVLFHMGCFCVIFTILLALIYRSKNKRS